MYVSHLDLTSTGRRALNQARGDVAVGLVTGNLEPIAWGKMQALGLLEAFSEPHFGGFGSDFCSGDHTLHPQHSPGQYYPPTWKSSTLSEVPPR